jgi:predicted flavoprotein YhiN
MVGGGLAVADARRLRTARGGRWAEALGQPVFTGSTGRVFPEVMKASPLLRAWLRRIGAELRLGWRWTGWDGAAIGFSKRGGRGAAAPARHGSGARRGKLAAAGVGRGMGAAFGRERGVDLAPFRPANMGFAVDWTPHMAPHLGQPLKSVRLIAGDQGVRGEAVISARGIEGGGVYAVSAAVRDGALRHRPRPRPERGGYRRAPRGASQETHADEASRRGARPRPGEARAASGIRSTARRRAPTSPG